MDVAARAQYLSICSESDRAANRSAAWPACLPVQPAAKSDKKSLSWRSDARVEQTAAAGDGELIDWWWQSAGEERAWKEEDGERLE